MMMVILERERERERNGRKERINESKFPVATYFMRLLTHNAYLFNSITDLTSLADRFKNQEKRKD